MVIFRLKKLGKINVSLYQVYNLIRSMIILYIIFIKILFLRGIQVHFTSHPSYVMLYKPSV